MIVTAIYGTEHVGSTVHLSRMAIETLQPDEVHEFFLPRDFHHMCTGCNACFFAPVACCAPAHAQIAPILDAIDRADVLILASPVYVYHVTGAMKSFLDHFGCRWMLHRPSPSMFTKRALLLTTAAGGGMRRTLQDLQDSMNFWGVGRVVRLGRAIHALTWDAVSPAMRSRLERDVQKACRRLRVDRPVKPRLYVRLMFGFFRRLLPRMNTATDLQYWETQGWFSGHKPW